MHQLPTNFINLTNLDTGFGIFPCSAGILRTISIKAEDELFWPVTIEMILAVGLLSELQRQFNMSTLNPPLNLSTKSVVVHNEATRL